MKHRNSSGDVAWDDLRIAAAVLRCGSLSGAARETALSVPTVGRRLDRLEESLGVKLFHRHAAGITAAAHAHVLLAHADELAARVDDLMRAASAAMDAAEGTVTVTTVETVVTQVIAPRLSELRARHPRLNLVLRATNRIERLDRRRADIAVRIVRPTEERLVARKLGEQRMGLYAARAYLARKGRPARPSKDLIGHDVVTYEGVPETMPEVRWLADRTGGKEPAYRVSSVAAVAAVVESGAAIGILPSIFEARGPEKLEQLVGSEAIPSRELWLVMHEDLRDAPHVRAVADFLTEVVRDALGP